MTSIYIFITVSWWWIFGKPIFSLIAVSKESCLPVDPDSVGLPIFDWKTLL
jgi:hypothetical protein